MSQYANCIITFSKRLVLCSLFFYATVACQSSEESASLPLHYPLEVDTPKAVYFDALIYENDFDKVPLDGKVEEYSKEHNDAVSGYVFRLDNDRQYSPGLKAVLKEAIPGTWFKIGFDAYKASVDIKGYENTKGVLVVSWHRQDSLIHYHQTAIVDWLKQYNRHMVDHWEHIVQWLPVPGNVQAGDQLKVYIYNAYGGAIYMDNLRVERWYTVSDTGLCYPEKLLSNKGFNQDGNSYATVVNQNNQQYLNCYETMLGDAIDAGDKIRLKMTAKKSEKIRFYAQSVQLVVSIERGNKTVLWKGIPVEAKMLKNGNQVLNVWQEVSAILQLPPEAQPGDVLKIYAWNQQARPFFVKGFELYICNPDAQ